jgi:hypothetical protein
MVFTRPAIASISGREAQVEEQDLVFRVVGDPHDLVGVQARVQRVQHGPGARRGVVQLHVTVAVPGQRGHAVAEADAALGQRVGHAPGPAAISR